METMNFEIKPYCNMCEKRITNNVFLHDGGIYCSKECIKEDCGHLPGFKELDYIVKKVRMV